MTTQRQRDYLSAIDRVSTRIGYPPSLAQVAEEMATCTTAARTMVHRLAREGMVTRDYATPRSLRITDAGRLALAGEAA